MTNVETSDANPVLAEKKSDEKPVTAAPVQSAETIRNDAKEPKKQTPNAKSNKQNDQTDEIVVSDEKIEMGDMIIDENGIRDKKTGKLVVSDDESDEPKSLTPEQLRRLQKLREGIENKKKRIVIVKPPTPPTPEQ